MLPEADAAVSTGDRIVAVAIDVPLRRTFDYRVPAALTPPAPGCRVRVPFAGRERVGVVWETLTAPRQPDARLLDVIDVLDAEPLLGPPLMALVRFASEYYLHAPGEVIAAALPTALRRGAEARLPTLERYALTPAGAAANADTLRRAPLQAAMHERLLSGPATPQVLRELGGGWRPALRRLEERGWVQRVTGPPPRAVLPEAPADIALNPEQLAAAGHLMQLPPGQAALLDGVTGSGKTEVYLEAARDALARGRQVLWLVPEIALTDQTLDRILRMLGGEPALLHSGLPDGERLRHWLRARSGEAGLILGTRSAIFAPAPALELIVVDEEHDASYKQQDGLRYHARDLALLRAHREHARVVLGSATPALPTLRQAEDGRIAHLRLPQRASGTMPQLRLVDVRGERLDGGIGAALRHAMAAHLDRGNQVLLFLNRRGFAPALRCAECGDVPTCRGCDRPLTFHRGRGRLLCHHCLREQPVPAHCPAGHADYRPIGAGTERVGDTLAALFPDVPALRIDRDATSRRGSLASGLRQAREGQVRLLVGTQMLTKGHHFPGVTLVGVLDADGALYAGDPFATERFAQLIHQVAGRCGRGTRQGEVLLQTHQPEHPLVQTLLQADYAHAAKLLMAERRALGWPPFAHLAVLRAEAPNEDQPLAFLEAARALAEDAMGVQLLGPIAALQPRRAGQYRAQLLLEAPWRPPLRRLLADWVPRLEGLRRPRRLRWSLDVDPVEID